MQDCGKGCVTLGFHPPPPSCFAQRRSDAAFWTCLESAGFFSVQELDGNRQEKDDPAKDTDSVQHQVWQERRRSSPRLHPVSSDRGAVQLYLLWLHETGRSSRSWLDKTASINQVWELLIWGSLALEKDDRNVNNWGAKYIYPCALKSRWVILIKAKVYL